MPEAAKKAKCWISTYGGPEARDVNARSAMCHAGRAWDVIGVHIPQAGVHIQGRGGVPPEEDVIAERSHLPDLVNAMCVAPYLLRIHFANPSFV